jgi:hypothetical protein
MDVFVTSLAAKFLAPWLALPAIACGALMQNWRFIIAASIAIGFAHEALLLSMSEAHQYTPLIVVAGSLAALLWCALSRVIAGEVRKRMAGITPP